MCSKQQINLPHYNILPCHLWLFALALVLDPLSPTDKYQVSSQDDCPIRQTQLDKCFSNNIGVIYTNVPRAKACERSKVRVMVGKGYMKALIWGGMSFGIISGKVYFIKVYSIHFSRTVVGKEIQVA